MDGFGQRAGSPRRGRFLRRAIQLLVVCALAAGLVAGLLWWQERPLALASAALERGDAESALRLVSEFVERHPNHGHALSLQARALVAQLRSAEALRLYERVGASDVVDLHAWARAYLIEQQWSAALPLLQRVIEIEPDNADALHEITACRVRLGALREALTTAERFARIPGNEARGNLFLGTIHGDLGNYQQAVEAYARVLDYAPDAENLQAPASEFFLQYARTLLDAGQPRASLPLVGRSLVIRPTAEGFVLLGNAASQIGEAEQASAAWRKALELDASNQQAREALANVAIQSGNAAEALQWLQPLENDPALKASTAYLFVRAHALRKDDAAIRAWQERTDALREREKLAAAVENTLREAPQSFWGRVIRAHRFAGAGNWKQAETMLTPLLDEAPEEPFVVKLARAVASRGPLPPLEELPIKQF